jgi:hypothetical protein
MGRRLDWYGSRQGQLAILCEHGDKHFVFVKFGEFLDELLRGVIYLLFVYYLFIIFILFIYLLFMYYLFIIYVLFIYYFFIISLFSL